MDEDIHGWIGGPDGSPSEYGLPLDDSYLFEAAGAADDEPVPCPCGGAEWVGCACQPMLENENLPALMEDLNALENPPAPDWRRAA